MCCVDVYGAYSTTFFRLKLLEITNLNAKSPEWCEYEIEKKRVKMELLCCDTCFGAFFLLNRLDMCM